MHDHPAVIFAALLILVYGVISNISERASISGPMFFMLTGILVSPLGFDLFELHINANTVKIVAEITLILVLFTDATLINLRELFSAKNHVAIRLLLIGLPLTMLLGFGLAVPLFQDINLVALALMAIILSPTDAALGQVVIKSRQIPSDVRRAVSVESGINDGIALPPVFVCIAVLAATSGANHGSENWLAYTGKQLSLGPLIGALVGWLGGWLVERASVYGWMQPTFQRLAALSLALMAFALAEYTGGNGFIAAFAAGLFLGIKNPDIRERIQEFGEAEGTLLSLSVFLIFGIAIIPITAGLWGWAELLYAILSLTIIRIVPVFFSLIGTKLDFKTRLFFGWFGPRGIASILYLLIIVNQLGVSGYETIMSVIVLTIGLSVIFHGVSAQLLVKLFSK